MAGAPRVSVLMPVYNAARYLAEAVESVLAQTFPDFELVAVDDGSADDSLAVLGRYAAADPRVRVFPRPHRGLVPTLREAVDLAAAPLLARMDADDVAAADRLALQVEFLDRHPDHVLVGSRYAFVGPSGERTGAPVVPLDHAGIDAYHMSGRGCILNHSSVVFRRDTYLRVGGYQVGCLAEDFDLWLRMAEVGKLAAVDRELIRYRVHPESAMRLGPKNYDRGMWRAIRDAVVRRGYPLARVPFADLGNDEQMTWIAMALDVGQAGVARRWAAGRAARRPTAGRLKQLGKAVLGPWLGAVGLGPARVRGRASVFDYPGAPAGGGRG